MISYFSMVIYEMVEAILQVEFNGLIGVRM